jgi:hypothetical protein
MGRSMNKRFRLVNQNVKFVMLSVMNNLPVSEENPLIVKVEEETRNLDQNAALWPLLECFSEQLQWLVNGQLTYLSAENWKEILTAAFKQEHQRMAQGINGGFVFLGQRTSKMKKNEFSEFLEFIHMVAAERGVNLERKAA